MGDAKINRVPVVLGIFFLLICVAVCGLFCMPFGSRVDPVNPGTAPSARESAPVKKITNQLLWRKPFSVQANRPVALPDGWFAFTREGRCERFSASGQSLWICTLSNQQWQAALLIPDERIVLVSQRGGVCVLTVKQGTVVWSVQTEGCFTQPPLFGLCGHVASLWVIAQDDGRIFCLRAADGHVSWIGSPTNRSDGEPAHVGEWLVYGNCDGAIHLFQMIDGQHVASIPVGESDQMAGGICVLKRGVIVTGTRSGLLIAADLHKRDVLARAKLDATETFATPLEYVPDRIAMATPDGRLTFWKFSESTLIADGVVPLGSMISEAVQTTRAIWCIADQTIVRVDVVSRVQTRYALGDDYSGLVAGLDDDRVACMVDGDLVVVKGVEK